MKVSKWIDMGQEVEVEIGMDDIRAALNEAFSRVTTDPLGEEGPNVRTVMMAFNGLANFLNALTDAQIAMLTSVQQDVIRNFLARSAERFAGAMTSRPTAGA